MATVKKLDEEIIEEVVTEQVVEETPVVDEPVVEEVKVEEPVVEEPVKKSTKKKAKAEEPVVVVEPVKVEAPVVEEKHIVILSVNAIQRKLRIMDNNTNYRYELEDLFNIRASHNAISFERLSALLSSNASASAVYDELR